MPQTRTNCPRCKTPLLVDVEQLFDLNADPQAKNKLLSGSFNLISCKNCGYQGLMSTPLVYHDPSKELLLTYFPPELGLPVNEQERLIGPLITQVVNRLPAEKRKAYLLRPQSMFTMQTMIEKILEADGITKEMLDAQQKRLAFLQRLLSTREAADRAEIIKQEEALVDESLFSILSRLGESAMAQGDQQLARSLAAVQQELLSQTKIGQQLQSQSKEAEAALKSLQEASEKGLTREKLLDLLVNAPTETRLNTLVSLARSGLDYAFFQILSDRINAASGDDKQKLVELRDKLLKLTSEIDKATQQQQSEARQLLEKIVSAPDISQAAMENMESINDFFMEILQSEMQAARQKADLDRIGKLQKIVKVVEEASAPPPELELIDKLVATPDEAARQKLLEDNAAMITPEFIDLLNNLMMQSETQEQLKEAREQIELAYSSALRFSMQANLKKM
ncbi:MAG TPA: CpXC domain-containing protein [Anaerolineaceae bacterium]|nr:CpXC domain-containing protein [Anaerolineaceae bacterium]